MSLDINSPLRITATPNAQAVLHGPYYRRLSINIKHPKKIRPCIRNPALTRFYEKIGLEMRWTSLSINHRREKNDTSTTPEV